MMDNDTRAFVLRLKQKLADQQEEIERLRERERLVEVLSSRLVRDALELQDAVVPQEV